MYTRFHLYGLLTSTMIQILGLNGVITVNLFCIFYWNYEEDIQKRLLEVIPLRPISTMVFLLINILAYLAFVSHVRGSVCDPGVMTRDIRPPSIVPTNEIRTGQKGAMNWKPFRAHHCSVGNSGIYKMDHHCPWTNNGIGIKNMKYFFLFLSYSSIGGFLSLMLHIVAFYNYYNDTETDYSCFTYFYAIGGGFLFNIFGSIMFPTVCIPLIFNLLEVFEFNQTYVEDLKNLYGKPYGKIMGLHVHLGQDKLWWWLPTKPVLLINYGERSYTEKEIETRIFKQYTNFIFDPQDKQKAIELQESKKDKIILISFTLLLIVTTYTFGYGNFSI